MMTVNEVSKIAGVSVRTLHYYDGIGLLSPAKITEAGYRLYNDESLERLRHIMFFRELDFPLAEIKSILESSGFDRQRALSQQEELLRLRAERLQRLIELAHNTRMKEVIGLDFKAFDTKKIEEYTEKAKEQWGETTAYKEFEKKQQNRSIKDTAMISEGLMAIFAELGKIKEQSPAGEAAQALVEKLRGYITENFYDCKKEILSALGMMYSAGGEMTDNINSVGGEGTAKFASDAIAEYCGK